MIFRYYFSVKKTSISYSSLPFSIAIQARAASSSISIAGSFFPSRNSRNAPPPVDMYEIFFSTLNFDTAAIVCSSDLNAYAIVSPPPAIE